MMGTYSLRAIYDSCWHNIPYASGCGLDMSETIEGNLEIHCEGTCTVEEVSNLVEADSQRTCTWFHVNNAYMKILNDTSLCVWNNCLHKWDTGYYRGSIIKVFDRKYVKAGS
jgi:hypothetical protein